MWEAEFTDEYHEWYRQLSVKEQEAIDAHVRLLQDIGPHLGRPHVDTVNRFSRHRNMKELRVQCAGDPIRILFAFDPRRVAILLHGGGKVGNDRWYKQNVPIADRLYDKHLASVRKEELGSG